MTKFRYFLYKLKSFTSFLTSFLISSIFGLKTFKFIVTYCVLRLFMHQLPESFLKTFSAKIPFLMTTKRMVLITHTPHHKSSYNMYYSISHTVLLMINNFLGLLYFARTCNKNPHDQIKLTNAAAGFYTR